MNTTPATENPEDVGKTEIIYNNDLNDISQNAEGQNKF